MPKVIMQLFPHIGHVSCCTWQCRVLAKLRAMVGLQSAKFTLAVWKAVIDLFYQGLLGIFYQCHDGFIVVGIGVVANGLSLQKSLD